jgi:hypothetical protein
VFNKFILIEKFSGKYCDGKFESVLINCFKKIAKVKVCVVTVTKPIIKFGILLPNIITLIACISINK